MKTNNTEPIEVRTEGGWVIKLFHSAYNDMVELWIGKKIDDKFYLAKVGMGGFLETHLVENGTREENPTMRLNSEAWEGFAEAIRGVLPPAIDKKEVDAELKATKYHLEDMRNLVFKKKE